MKARVICFVMILCASLVIPTPVAADDAADSCANAESLPLPSGSISGTLSPEDSDAYLVDMEEGDFLTVQITRSNPSVRFSFDRQEEGRQTRGSGSLQEPEREPQEKIKREDKLAIMSFAEAGGGDGVYRNQGFDRYLWYSGEEEIKLQIFKEGSGQACVDLRTVDEGASAYNITYVFNDNDPPEQPTEQIDRLESQVNQLQNQLEGKNKSISELENKIETKDQRISELKTELKNTQKPIEVTVNPADGANSFQAGGQAVVAASGAAASVLADLTVEYGTEIYTVGEDGQLRIPLGESGQQQMAFNYQDSETSVTLNVESQPSSETPTSTGTADTPDPTETSPDTTTDQSGTADPTTQDSDGDGVPDSEDYAPRDPDVQDESDIRTQETNTFGPGFGVGAVTVTVVSLLLVVLRRRSI